MCEKNGSGILQRNKHAAITPIHILTVTRDEGRDPPPLWSPHHWSVFIHTWNLTSLILSEDPLCVGHFFKHFIGSSLIFKHTHSSEEMRWTRLEKVKSLGQLQNQQKNRESAPGESDSKAQNLCFFPTLPWISGSSLYSPVDSRQQEEMSLPDL